MRVTLKLLPKKPTLLTVDVNDHIAALVKEHQELLTFIRDPNTKCDTTETTLLFSKKLTRAGKLRTELMELLREHVPECMNLDNFEVSYDAASPNRV